MFDDIDKYELINNLSMNITNLSELIIKAKKSPKDQTELIKSLEQNNEWTQQAIDLINILWKANGQKLYADQKGIEKLIMKANFHDVLLKENEQLKKSIQ